MEGWWRIVEENWRYGEGEKRIIGWWRVENEEGREF